MHFPIESVNVQSDCVFQSLFFLLFFKKLSVTRLILLTCVQFTCVLPSAHQLHIHMVRSRLRDFPAGHPLLNAAPTPTPGRPHTHTRNPPHPHPYLDAPTPIPILGRPHTYTRSPPTHTHTRKPPHQHQDALTSTVGNLIFQRGSA